MKLKNAARYFDTETATDAYTGATLFKAQLSTYDGSSPDGSFQRRRTVSMAPEVVIPARSTIAAQGAVWVLGDFMMDSYRDIATRKTCSAKKASALFTVLTPGKAALRDSVNALTAYGAASYLRDTVNSLTDTDYTPFYNVSFAGGEVIPEGCFLRTSGQYLHTRGIRQMADGFLSVGCDEIALDNSAVKNCEVNVTLAGEVSPVTELATGSAATTGILLDMYMLHSYRTQADDKYSSGDMSLILANAINVHAGQALTINGVKWRVAGFAPYHDAWNVHIRRA